MNPELSTRSETRRLAAASLAIGGGSVVETFARLFAPEAKCAAWRILDFASLTGAPFSVRVGWSSGKGGGNTVKIVVSRGTRLTLYAQTLQIDVANLSTAENQIVATVSDGTGNDSANFYEVRGAGDQAVQAVTIPPYAKYAKLETGDPGAFAGAYLQTLDGAGTVRQHVAYAAQPDEGTPIGAAASMRILSTAAWRVVFYLSV